MGPMINTLAGKFECGQGRSAHLSSISGDLPSLNDIFMRYTPLVGSVLHEPVSLAD